MNTSYGAFSAAGSDADKATILLADPRAGASRTRQTHAHGAAGFKARSSSPPALHLAWCATRFNRRVGAKRPTPRLRGATGALVRSRPSQWRKRRDRRMALRM